MNGHNSVIIRCLAGTLDCWMGTIMHMSAVGMYLHGRILGTGNPFVLLLRIVSGLYNLNLAG